MSKNISDLCYVKQILDPCHQQHSSFSFSHLISVTPISKLFRLKTQQWSLGLLFFSHVSCPNHHHITLEFQAIYIKNYNSYHFYLWYPSMSHYLLSLIFSQKPLNFSFHFWASTVYSPPSYMWPFRNRNFITSISCSELSKGFPIHLG